VHELPEHRADQGHLHHHPLNHVKLLNGVPRQKLPRFLSQVEKDRHRFEQLVGLPTRAVVIDDDRHLGQRVEPQEFRLELRLAKDIDGMHGIGQPHLLEGDIDLDDVWTAHSVKVDHLRAPDFA